MSAAARASALSNPLTPAMTGARRWGGAGRPVAVGAAAGRGAGVGGAGACAGTGAGACAAATGAAAAAGAAGAGAGIFIVGAAVGLGGKLIRTVSFFGCTLAASAGFGGTAPEGGIGMLSAITFWVQTRVDANRCQMLIREGNKTDRRKPVRLQVGLSSESSVTLAATAALASAAIATNPTPATAAGTGRAFFTRPRDVDSQRPALKLFAVEHFDGLVRLLRS